MKRAFFLLLSLVLTSCEKPYDPTRGPMDAPLPMFLEQVNPLRWGASEAEVDAAMQNVDASVPAAMRTPVIEDQSFGRVYFFATTMIYVAQFDKSGLSRLDLILSAADATTIKRMAEKLGQVWVANMEYPVLDPAETSNTRITHWVGGSEKPDLLKTVNEMYPPRNNAVTELLSFIPR